VIGNTWGYLASAAGGRAEYAFAIFLLSVFPFMIFNGVLVVNKEIHGKYMGNFKEMEVLIFRQAIFDDRNFFEFGRNQTTFTREFLRNKPSDQLIRLPSDSSSL